MMRAPTAALLLACLLAPHAAPAQAFSPAPALAQASGQFTPAQREEIVAIVRAALRSDPSILRDAVIALQADEGVRQDAAMRAAIAASREGLTRDGGDPVAGNPGGDVTIVEFFDIRCPYCRRLVPVLDDLLSRDRGVRLVLKDLPILGPPSVLGAKALLAAQRQGGYVKLQEALMRDSAPLTEEALRRQAAAIGLDWDRLQRDMADPAIQRHLDADLALAHGLNIQGTPALIIGDKLIPGAVELAELEQAVAAARGH